jgi:hypothetical protein
MMFSLVTHPSPHLRLASPRQPLASTSLHPFSHFTSLPSQFTFISSNKQFSSTNQTNRPSGLTAIVAFASTEEKKLANTSPRTRTHPLPLPLPLTMPTRQPPNTAYFTYIFNNYDNLPTRQSPNTPPPIHQYPKCLLAYWTSGLLDPWTARQSHQETTRQSPHGDNSTVTSCGYAM